MICFACWNVLAQPCHRSFSIRKWEGLEKTLASTGHVCPQQVPIHPKIKLQLNLSKTATLGTEESGHGREVAIFEKWPS